MSFKAKASTQNTIYELAHLQLLRVVLALGGPSGLISAGPIF